jgi:uncharacterized RDD family membrane protein YckC
LGNRENEISRLSTLNCKKSIHGQFTEQLLLYRKRIVGTRIASAETNELIPLIPLIVKRVIAIQVLSMIPYFGSFVNLVDALLIFRENRRCLHDDFAGTKVIKAS